MSCQHEHDHAPPPLPTNASQNLHSRIDTHRVTALNLANPTEELAHLFRNPADRNKLVPVTKSDADAQLIINIPFTNSSVKLFSIIIRSNGSDHCPRHIKLYKNDKQIDFDTNKKPLYTLEHPRVGVMYNDEDDMPELVDDEDSFVEHFLPRHKFSGVQQLTLLIEDAYGDEDETWLHYIELRGEATDLSKDPVITIYESAANPADHKKVENELKNTMGV